MACVSSLLILAAILVQGLYCALGRGWDCAEGGGISGTGGDAGVGGIGEHLLCVVAPFIALFSCPSIPPGASLLTFVLFLALDVILACWCFVGALAVPNAFAFASTTCFFSSAFLARLASLAAFLASETACLAAS